MRQTAAYVANSSEDSINGRRSSSTAHLCYDLATHIDIESAPEAKQGPDVQKMPTHPTKKVLAVYGCQPLIDGLQHPKPVPVGKSEQVAKQEADYPLPSKHFHRFVGRRCSDKPPNHGCV